MRRRISLTMVLMVVTALLVSGAVTLLVAQRSAEDQTRRELVREATGLAASVKAESSSRQNPAEALRNILLALGGALRLDGFAVLAVSPGGRVFQPVPLNTNPRLPSGLSARDLDPGRLYRLEPVSGARGGVEWAAYPYVAEVEIGRAPRRVVQVVLLTRRAPSALGSAGLWLLVSSLAILAAAAVVAWRLGERFARPVRAAGSVARRIAAGDLEARVPAPPRGTPELADLAVSINTMTESLQRAKRSEQHFLQSVSHDLRTPLTSIRGYAEAIEDGAAADPVAAARVIASEARRLQRLVGDLLALATLEARRFALHPRPLDLAAAAAESVAGFRPAAAELGLRLELLPTPDAGPVVVADPDRLAQVVANLVENALRYAATTVSVGVRSEAGRPVLEVCDDGPGIPAGELARVFERLYAGRDGTAGGWGPAAGAKTVSRPIGSGLGLTIVAELVAAMGGAVRAESPAGPAGGTRMVVELPPGEVPP